MNRNDSFSVGASPVPSIVAGANGYAEKSGIEPLNTGFGHVVMPESVSRRIASAYDRMPSFDNQAVPAFHAMAEETGRQFDHMTRPRSKGGMGIDVEVTKHDPYGAAGYHTVIPELRDDVENNHRIKVLSTGSTGGHPYFSNDQNDMFRAVHDVFGHLGSGRGVDFGGEEAAFQKHSSMFSPLARQAMTSETRGQNSSLRVTGQFPEQKIALLPNVMQRAQFSSSASPDETSAAREIALKKNREQGIG